MDRPSRIASTAIGFLNRVEDTANMIISELPSMGDEEVLEVRQQARTMGYMSWRVECACDAEVARRSQERSARGRYDEEGREISKAVHQYAQMCEVATSTVYENASIHATFFSSSSARTREIENGGLRHLQEKEYYRAALYADDPWAALERFAKAKADNCYFSTRDAWRMNKEEKTPPLDSTVPALCEDPAVVAVWEKLQLVFRELVSLAPRLQGLINGYQEEIQYELTVPNQTVEQAIYDFIQQGYDECDMIAVRMRKDRIFVTVWLNRLVELGKLESFEKERAPGARGAARTGYREI